jgi:two-component system, NtrC family, sensor kinase
VTKEPGIHPQESEKPSREMLMAALAERERELAESRRREQATAEVINVISRSRVDLDAVLARLTDTARLLCGAANSAVHMRDGDLFRIRAQAGCSPEFVAYQVDHPIDPGTEGAERTHISRAALSGKVVEIADVLEAPDHFRLGRAPELGNFRAILGVPLLRDGRVEGVFSLARPTPGGFPREQIELVRTFADQAMIAIENARLFDEVQANKRDLEESLAQQTATADVLKVISRSAFDLQVVLDALLGSAVRLSGVRGGAILLREGEAVRVRAVAGRDAEYTREVMGRLITASGRSTAGRVLRSGEVEQIPDLRLDSEYDLPRDVNLARLGVPMLRNGKVEGVIVLAREEPGPFSRRVIELVQTFADQAVIAIENVRLFGEIQEALQRETATSEILRVISQSPTDARPVFDSIVLAAVRSLRCDRAVVLLRDGDVYIHTTGATPQGPMTDFPPDRVPIDPSANFPSRAILDKETLSLPDWSQIELPDHERNIRVAFGVNSALYLPLLREGDCIGLIVLLGTRPNLFGPKEIAQAESFRDQALIAMENARLFNETTEALARQTATSEVLQVIGSSVSDATPVFDKILESCQRLFNGAQAVLSLVREDGQVYHHTINSVDPETARQLNQGFPRPLAQAYQSYPIRKKCVVHYPDILNGPGVPEGMREIARRAPNFSMLIAPMFWAGRGIGTIHVVRFPPVPFNDKDAALLRTFADQAVIAIQNARMFDEVQAKTRDLEEALAQQTATADVLKVISRSAFDLDAVLKTLTDSARSLSGAALASVFTHDGEVMRIRAESGFSPALIDYARAHPIRAGRQTFTGRAALSGEVVHIPDVLADPDYDYGDAPRLGDYRAGIGVPLVRDGKVEGVFALMRPQPGAFTPRQIEMASAFADQAVIAIENARLFNEVQAKTRDLEESLQQQTATADVLKVISRSAFDLPTVLRTLVESAAKLCDADRAIVTREVDGVLYRAESYGFSDEFMANIRRIPVVPERGTVSGRVLLEGKAVQVADVEADPEYTLKDYAKMGEFQTCLGIPMLRNGAPIGVLSLLRTEIRPFNDKQIELVQTFADQAVIAIENARLFEQVQAKTRDLEEALQQQTATANVLKIISRSAFDLQAVLTTLAESARELCGASFVTLNLREGEVMRLRAQSGCTPEIVAFLHAHPIRAGRETYTGRVMLSGEPVHLPDVLTDPEYSFGEGPSIGNYRALLCVPLLREGRVEGVFALARPEPLAFTERQIEIVRAFADQAVIAIQNARLFGEVQARTNELTSSLQNLRNAQDRLIQSEKLASLGQLTAGIAHEIKNPLNFVNNFSGMSRELLDELKDVLAKAPLDAATRHEADDLVATVASNLDKVVQHGRRADSIVKNMLLHSREGSGERTETNVNAMVEEALNLAYHGARAEKPGFNVTIVRELDPDAGKADLYPQEITRVLLNLISNGFYATTQRLQAGSEPGYESTLTASTRNLGDHVEIAIKDNGAGIPDNVKEKMFNPFFTTKPAGEGTGLGLSLSHDIVVKQHGGAIDVDSEPGSTRFVIRLPRADLGR